MPQRLLSADGFRAEAKEGRVLDAIVFRLSSAPSETVQEQDRTERFVFSDATIDLAGDKIFQDGWQLQDFANNPIALFSHQSSEPPIGRASNVGVTAGVLKGDIEFAPPDVYPFADTVYRLVKGGYLRAVSVGFMPLDWEFSKDKSRPFGIDFKRQSLLEISVCCVPCNPSALHEARSAGIDTRPVQEWAARLLDGGGQVVVPRSVLEETFRQAKTPRSVRQRYLAPQRRAETADWKVGAARDLAIDSADSWDGPAAAERMLDAAGFNGDSPDSATARRGFLIYDAANADLKGSYKLPFADIVGGELKAVAGGIHAAASRLPQTDAPQSALDDAREVLDSYEGNMNKSAQRRAAFETLHKDLYDVSWLASLLQGLAGLADWVGFETEIEGDDSTIAARLAAVVNELGQILIDMTAEEVAELLSDDDDDMDAMMLAARTPAQKLLVTLAAHVREKGGRSVSAANAALLTKAMDHHASATQCIKDVLASNETDEPADPDPADEPIVVVTLTAEQERAKRLDEARALKAALAA